MKKLIIGLFIGTLLTSSTAYAFAIKNKVEKKEVETVQISSEILNTNKINVYRFIDGSTKCYVSPVTNSKGII